MTFDFDYLDSEQYSSLHFYTTLHRKYAQISYWLYYTKWCNDSDKIYGCESCYSQIMAFTRMDSSNKLGSVLYKIHTEHLLNINLKCCNLIQPLQ